MGRRLVGLFEVTSVGVFPRFDIITNCASFHWIGKWQRHNVLLYVYVTSRMAFPGRFLSVVATIGSCPEALCEVSRLLHFLFNRCEGSVWRWYLARNIQVGFYVLIVIFNRIWYEDISGPCFCLVVLREVWQLPFFSIFRCLPYRIVACRKICDVMIGCFISCWSDG
jgi:hypothetical protein